MYQVSRLSEFAACEERGCRSVVHQRQRCSAPSDCSFRLLSTPAASVSLGMPQPHPTQSEKKTASSMPLLVTQCPFLPRGPITDNSQNTQRDASSLSLLSVACWNNVRCRKEPVSRRAHCRLEPGMRGREETVVHVYTGATAGVAWFWLSLQERPNLTR